jgi:hypothetical protein
VPARLLPLLGLGQLAPASLERVLTRMHAIVLSTYPANVFDDFAHVSTLRSRALNAATCSAYCAADILSNHSRAWPRKIIRSRPWKKAFYQNY